MKRSRYFRIILALLLATATTFPAVEAQRIVSPLGRGITAVYRNDKALISWRKLAQDPEEATYRVYLRTGESAGWQALNNTPVKVSNLEVAASRLTDGCQLAVSLITKGVEGPKSPAYTYHDYGFVNMFLYINFEQAGSPIPCTAANRTKFVWPCDLDGDGEMDYVLDRRGGFDSYLEAYTSQGEYLWSVNVGPNIMISVGQNDAVCVGDFDCNGRCDVVFQASDSTRFWDKAKNDWGLWLDVNGTGGSTPDTDGDGIVNYRNQSVKNPPQYMAVIDGLTGAQKAVVEMNYPNTPYDHYTRFNKADYWGDEYPYLNGKMGLAYLDGIHPSAVMEYCDRSKNGSHHYYTSAYGYDFSGGTAGEWKEQWQFVFDTLSIRKGEFHHIRIGDVDGDGKDETCNGVLCVDHDGTCLYSSGISHGDRFRLSDIDPDRPGPEIYAIQQNAADLLGQLIYDARTGQSIKRWYLGSVGDVGRGECMDVLPQYKGYEIWSTMANMYTAQGDVAIEGTNAQYGYPTEGIWWDGDLGRESVQTKNGASNMNLYVQKYVHGDGLKTLIEFWRSPHAYGISGARAMFWGDIVGDWREEVILDHYENGVYDGIMGFATNYATDIDNIYCLQQDVNYHGQCTNRGYYQSPMTGFYLGYDMPAPPLPQQLFADTYWSAQGTVWENGGNGFTNLLRNQSQTYTDGQSVLFGLDGATAVDVPAAVSPDTILWVVPAGQTYTFGGTGSLCPGDAWKTGEGTVVLGLSFRSDNPLVVSEGTVQLNADLESALDLRARGILSGNGHVKGPVSLEGALNYACGKLSPGTSEAPFGTIVLDSGLNVTDLLYIDLDINTATDDSDRVVVGGSLCLGADLVFNITADCARLPEGLYTLMEWTDSLSGDLSHCRMRGISGLKYSIRTEGKRLVLDVEGQRSASNSVRWTGATDGNWDYQTPNFSLDGEATTFVADDGITIDDNALTLNLVLNDLFPTGGVRFENEGLPITLSGEGGLSGSGGLVKTGDGDLYLLSKKSDYTGATQLKGGTTYVAELTLGGTPGSLGAGTSDIGLSNAALVCQHISASTDRGFVLTDTAAIEVPSGSLSVKGVISGNGMLVKRGAGSLTLNGTAANTFKKGLLIEEGSVIQGTYTTNFGPYGGSITAYKGTLRQYNNTDYSNSPSFNYVVNVPEKGHTLTFVECGRGTVNGTWKGKGATTFKPTYWRCDLNIDFSAYEGTVVSAANDTYENRYIKAMNMKKGRLQLESGSYWNGYKSGGSTKQDYTNYVGSLAGSGTLSNGTWNVGYDNTDSNFSGTFGDGVVFNKYGTGTLTVGANTGNINLNVKEGCLRTGGTKPTEGTVIAQGASARIEVPSGYIGAVTVQGGTLSLGNGSGRPAMIYAEGTINLLGNGTQNATLTLNRNRTGADRLYMMSGNLNLKSGTVIQLEAHSSALPLKSGDELQLFYMNGSGSISVADDVSIQSETLAEGLYWDLSSLADEGIVRVAGTADNLSRVWFEADGTPIVYDLLGKRVLSPTEGTMYIVNGKKIVY